MVCFMILLWVVGAGVKVNGFFAMPSRGDLSSVPRLTVGGCLLFVELSLVPVASSVSRLLPADPLPPRPPRPLPLL